ncbi:ATP-dependent RNA helicase ddx42, variant 2 [Balamuthia mandrillaris]
MSEEQVAECRTRLDIWVSGRAPPRLGLKWDHFGFPSKLLKKIAKQGFTEPTPIQKQAIPTALAGRDILGLAKTGSGKTLAFLLPLLLHIVDQPELQPGEGPVGLIVAPTRELAHQIYIVAQKFSKLFGIRVAAVYGGINRYQQSKKLQEACAIVVCTPGRLIDTIKKRNISMQRVTYLVLDEADKMFDMGFEPQVRSIVGQIRPDRQTLLFSATLKPFVSRLTEEILTNPVRITVGQVGEANADVQQVVEVLEETKKWDWLAHRMAAFVNSGNVLIFVATKKAAEELAANLAKMGWNVAALHGDKVQSERNSIMSLFKSGKTPVLVATDVAARGLDVPLIKTVVNYDSARDISAHTHRIGRTGRAGSQDGVAYSLVTPIEAPFAAELVHNLEAANQHVPPALRQLAAAAKQHQRRYPRGKGKASVPIANNVDQQRIVHRGGVGFALPPSSPFRGSSSGSSRSSSSSSSSFSGERTAFSQHKAVPTSHQSVHQAFRPASGSGESGSWKATK